MLKKIFECVPLPYYTQTTHPAGGWFPGGFHYGTFVPPYVESLAWMSSVFVHPTPTLTSAHSIFMMTVMYTDHWPSWGVDFHRFDSGSGEHLGRLEIASNIGMITLGGAFRSRAGKIYVMGYANFSFQEVMLGETKVTYGTSEIPGSKFGLLGFMSSGVGLDEFRDVFILPEGYLLNVYKYSTGVLLYSLPMPGFIASTALEDSDHIYVLLDNGLLILIDYVRMQVLGAVKVPPRASGGYWNVGSGCPITWDWVYKRLLIADRVPDNPDGSCATKVVGYRNVPIPTRLTTPIPLKTPRYGRTVPVMTQVVGDSNEGVGGYVVSSIVSGDAQLAGLTITDNRGVAITQVYCESSGIGKIVCMAKLETTETPSVIPRVDPVDPPVDPLDPGPTAPIGSSTVSSVYESQTWRLGEIYEDEPDGRGAFTEAVVDALHGSDENWGHIRKSPGQNQYHGHAVDAIVWKRPDGLTAEIYDIVTGSGDLQWGFVDGTIANRNLWYY